MSTTPKIGTIGWIDLTVPDAEAIRDFYADVVGWTPEACDMGGYNDYNMIPEGDGAPVGGVCHAKGTNADIPQGVWMVYFNVADLDASLASCTQHGGELVAGPKSMGAAGRYAIVRDPSGAVSALFENAS